VPAEPSRVYAALGLPIAGNPTEEMLEAAFAEAGIDARYLSLEVEPAALVYAVAGARALGFRGLHVTVPHKVAVLPLLDRVTPAATLAGAVNCVKREGDELVGDNTDGRGFLESLSAIVDPAGSDAVVLGAGGAARAIVAELALAGARRVTVVNRSLDRAAEVARSIGEATGIECRPEPLTAPWAVPGTAEVVVQATRVGMDDAGARLPLDWSAAREGAIAADVVIDPPRTAFLREAGAQGLRTLDGLGMLVSQAVLGFRWWTGAEPDADAMRRALEQALASPPLH
jgi:shikimate dehydrogenase